MRKLNFITCLIFFISFDFFANSSIPVKLKYGENVLSIKVSNNTSSLLKSLAVKINSNLPEGILITSLNNSIEVKPNNESNNTLKLKIVVNNNCKNGNYTVPLTLQDSLHNQWNYSLELELLNTVPLDFELTQNYPNPFNGSTNIKYSLPNDTEENVKLVIYNLLGQKVKTLVNEKQAAGNYNVVWNGKDETDKPCASGIYLYKISTNNFTDVKKMIFLE